MIQDHYDAAILCDKAYDTSRSDIWSAFETDALVRVKSDVVKINVRGTEFSKSLLGGNFSWEGAKNTLDVLKDLRAWPTWTADSIWAHKGFARGAKVWAEAYALRLATLDRPIELSGHSLGAGIVVQLAIILTRMGFKVRSVVTFGEPAGFYFGSEKKLSKLHIPITSYLHSNDWIQYAPPWGNTGVPRTRILPTPGVSRQAHDIGLYAQALAEKANPQD